AAAALRLNQMFWSRDTVERSLSTSQYGTRSDRVAAAKRTAAAIGPASRRRGAHAGRHGLARVVFQGRRGQLRQAYREGQEDQLGALGLVLNAIVVWNTRHMGLALDDLQKMGMPINPEDVERSQLRSKAGGCGAGRRAQRL